MLEGNPDLSFKIGSKFCSFALNRTSPSPSVPAQIWNLESWNTQLILFPGIICEHFPFIIRSESYQTF